MSEAAYERVKLARSSKRPTGLDYIHNKALSSFTVIAAMQMIRLS